MVAKLIVLYNQPEDPKAFDEAYFGEHVLLAEKIPGLQLIEVSRVQGSPTGSPAYYMMAELYFEDLDAVKHGMESAEGKEAVQHVKSFAGEPTMMFAEVHKS